MAHIEKYKAPALGNMCAHYDRSAELERGVVRDNIDPARTHLNYNLRPHADGMSQVQFINDRIRSLALKRAPRRDAVRMCDVVVTMPKGFKGDQREFFEAVCHTLDGIFGRDNCVSAYVHMDEASPHVHYAFVPVTGDGRLSAKSILNKPFMQRFHGRLEEGVSHMLGIDRAGLTLTDEEREERGGRYVDLNEFKSAKAQVDKAEARLEGLQRSEDQAREDIAELDRSIGQASAFIHDARRCDTPRKVETRAAQLETENEQLRERVSHLEGERARLEQRVGRLEQRVLQLREVVRGLGARLGSIQQAVFDMVGAVIAACQKSGVTQIHVEPRGLRTSEIPDLFRGAAAEGFGPDYMPPVHRPEVKQRAVERDTRAARPRTRGGLDH